MAIFRKLSFRIPIQEDFPLTLGVQDEAQNKREEESKERQITLLHSFVTLVVETSFNVRKERNVQVAITGCG